MVIQIHTFFAEHLKEGDVLYSIKDDNYKIIDKIIKKDFSFPSILGKSGDFNYFSIKCEDESIIEIPSGKHFGEFILMREKDSPFL